MKNCVECGKEWVDDSPQNCTCGVSLDPEMMRLQVEHKEHSGIVLELSKLAEMETGKNREELMLSVLSEMLMIERINEQIDQRNHELSQIPRLLQ